MFNVKNYEYDCTRKCRLNEHANNIISALTKRSISDEKLAAYIAKTCCNHTFIFDDLGRSAVHLAASVGRSAILEWLLNQGALLNTRDFESGSSPLHRAIFYGCIDCAVILIRYGANVETMDVDTRVALQNVCRVCDLNSPLTLSGSIQTEVLVWGSNKNYNLGISDEGGASSPQSVNFFKKAGISIQHIALGSYHSIFLDQNHQLYAVGHGKGGRLGLKDEISLPVPKRVKVTLKKTDDFIKKVSVSKKHSLLLTNRSIVFACGMNEDKQLGLRGAGKQVVNFKEVVTLRDIGVEYLKDIIARDQYSIAYSEESVFIWGTNNGQMLLNADVETVPLPITLKLQRNVTIDFIEANNSAIVIYTKDKLIILCYAHKMRVIKPPNHLALKSISVIGGDSAKATKGNPMALKLLLLTDTNVLFFWYEVTQSFYSCNISNLLIAQIDKILFKANQVIILSLGDVYKGKCRQVPIQKSELEKSRNSNNIWTRCDQNRFEISNEHMVRIDLQRLSNIDRAVNIFCDDDFSSFAIVQEASLKYFKPPAFTPQLFSFKKLLHDANEYDEIHDIVFHIHEEVFAAHKLIIYSRSPGLREIIKTFDRDIYLNYELLTGKMFEVMLKYIYTNYLPNDDDFDNIQTSLGPNAVHYPDIINICQLFLKFVEKFQLQNLAKYLKRFIENQPFYHPYSPDNTKYRFKPLNRLDFPELYDVTITCADNSTLMAHKCILVARMEYFEMMFSHSWAEKSSINLSTISHEYLEPIIDFLYNQDFEQFRKRNYSETMLYNMIVYCDQFFIERLREVCEILLLNKISLRKCGDMLDFACAYNCKVLKKGCLDFICQNLARVLNTKVLDNCDSDTLKCVNDHYREMFKEIFDYRVFTPHSNAIDDLLLLEIVDDFKVNLDFRMEETDLLLKQHKLKSIEQKFKQTTRQHEREAINVMMENINLDEQKRQSVSISENKITQDAKECDEKLQEESKTWMKVDDKKKQKKKNLNISSNEILKMEKKESDAFVSLVKTIEPTIKLDEVIHDDDTHNETPPRGFSLNLIEMTPREKLSQKERRRRISSSESSWRSPAVESTKPVQIPITSPPNAWGICATQSISPADDICVSSITPPTGSLQDSSSFANMIRKQIVNSSPTTQNSENSFNKILSDERKQREYYDKMRSKSLVLTQIEERAITELFEFYNVDNIDDEVITIARKTSPKSLNFAVWRH